MHAHGMRSSLHVAEAHFVRIKAYVIGVYMPES